MLSGEVRQLIARGPDAALVRIGRAQRLAAGVLRPKLAAPCDPLMWGIGKPLAPIGKPPSQDFNNEG
jgi:hypothetical protein